MNRSIKVQLINNTIQQLLVMDIVYLFVMFYFYLCTVTCMC